MNIAEAETQPGASGLDVRRPGRGWLKRSAHGMDEGPGMGLHEKSRETDPPLQGSEDGSKRDSKRSFIKASVHQRRAFLEARSPQVGILPMNALEVKDHIFF